MRKQLSGNFYFAYTVNKNRRKIQNAGLQLKGIQYFWTMKRKLEYDVVNSDVNQQERLCRKNETNEGEIVNAFYPKYFLRCHSWKNDAADVQTQVWHCAFEPDPEETGRTTNIVATCAGNSICFVNVQNGKVERKYYAKDIREMFYAVAWTTLFTTLADTPELTILAAAGARGVLHLIHPKNDVVFLEQPLKKSKKQIFVSSLLFHPKQTSILFCGMSNADVLVYDIGSPAPPNYNTTLTRLQTLAADSEIFDLTYCSKENILLAACNNGISAWSFSAKNMITSETRTDMLKFVMPAKLQATISRELQLVDSIEVIQDGIIATKCALHGVIYVWNLSSTLAAASTNQTTYHVKPTHILKWSSTDNYFMSMGTCPGNGLLACGDDKGAIWLYNIKRELQNRGNGTNVQPTAILHWPDVEDEYAEKKRKLQLGVYDIVLDKVTISSNGKYLVSVTSNNMVCIWKRNKTSL